MNSFSRNIFRGFGIDRVALVLVMAGIIWTNLQYRLWEDQRRIIVHDIILYYEYLPAAFIYHDLTLSFADDDPAYFKDKIWRLPTENGKWVTKMTMGLAVMNTPFFLAAHALASPLGYEPDGFTMPYRIALIIASIVYACMGLYLLLLLLRKYFARSAIAVTLVALGLGTNLYCYTTIDPVMSHSTSFFLFSAFLFLTDAWVKNQSWRNTVLLGLTGGLIILVRPTNGVMFILLLLWHVDSIHALKDRLMLFFRLIPKSAVIALLVMVLFLPQVMYWKYITGEYFYYSYGDERFFFNDPAFLKGLLSYRKGWLVYTPIMAFAVLGMVTLYFRHRKLFWPVLVFNLINMYVIWSWWCWWYGGSFGQRALIESYAVLAFPFAAFTAYVLEKRIWWRMAYIVMLTALISLNLFQTRQYYLGILHWDSMSKYSYWNNFFRLNFPPNFDFHMEPPDNEAAKKGDR